MNTSLTWEDLADLYKERTGGKAKIRPMDEIYDWAARQEDIKESQDGTLSLIINNKS